MGKFIIKTLILSFPVLIGIVFILIYLNHKNRQNSMFLNLTSANNIIIGHSHSEISFNDSIVIGSRNFSQGGESYFYTYLKLQEIIKSNPTIKNVFIEFTNNQINKPIDEWIWNDANIKFRFIYYFQYLTIKDNILIFRKNPISYIQNIPLLLKKQIQLLKNPEINKRLIGGSLRNNKNIVSLINKQIKRKPISNISLANYNIIYLKKIIQYLNLLQKKVILIRSPLHKSDPNYGYDKEYFEVLNSLPGDFTYYDFSNFKLSDSDFRDSEHLNSKGGIKFSKYLSGINFDSPSAKFNFIKTQSSIKSISKKR